MNVRARPWLWAATVAALALASCDGQDRYGVGPTVPVRGTLFVNGKPLRLGPKAFGRVWFYPDAAKGNRCPQVAVGDVDAQGQFTMAMRGGEGVPVGWYRVMVVVTENVNPQQPKSPRPSFVAKKYGSPETSGLRVQVVEASTAGSYDLQLQR